MRTSLLLAFALAGCAADLGTAPAKPVMESPPKPDSPTPQPQPTPQPPVDMGPDDATCGGQQFALTKVPPNVLLVLDRSGSMSEPINAGSATSKWDDLKSALTSVIGAYDSQLQLGASLFADASSGNSCAPGKIDVATGALHGTQVLAQVNASAPGSNTPTASTLDNVIAHGMLNDPTRDNVVVLATDGEPNCGDTDVVSRINTLYAQNPPVKTYVIGVGDATASDPATLNAWAVAGHTAQSGAATQYYQANSPTDLKNAFDAIAGGLVSCTFKLGATPPDPSQLYVFSNSQPVAADPANGFVYDASGPAVILEGSTCDALQKNPNGTKIQVVYGCPTPPPIN